MREKRSPGERSDTRDDAETIPAYRSAHAGYEPSVVARTVQRVPTRHPISQKSASSLVASLKIAISSASRAGVA